MVAMMNETLEQAIFAPDGPLVTRLRGQIVTKPTVPITQTFYRNLHEALDSRRAATTFYSLVENDWRGAGMADFGSNDLLSLGSNGSLSAEYLAELSRHPGFATTSGGSRMVDGTYAYLQDAEREIAAYHGYEAGVIVNSGYEANVAIWMAIPRPGDVMLYDEACHASTHDGMNQALTTHKVEFRHNDLESFRTSLLSIFEKHPLVKQGKRTVLVAVEAAYSMDGDVCPLQEMVGIAKDVSRNQGNVQFVVDEAYGTGTIGTEGKGLVCELQLEKEIAVVLHSFAKAVGSHGAIVVGDNAVRSMIANFARSFQFTTAVPFPLVANIRAAYKLISSDIGREARENTQYLVGLFFEEMTSHPLWDTAEEKGLLAIPLAKEWESRPFFTHVVTVWTRQECTYWLYFHLLFSGFNLMPVEHPVVPVNQSRLKVTVHGGNTSAQIEDLVKAIYEWVEEMLEIEEQGDERVSGAAAKVYNWMRSEGLHGFGMD